MTTPNPPAEKTAKEKRDEHLLRLAAELEAGNTDALLEILANEDAETHGIRIHRAFWIKLGRLAAMLEELERSRAFLDVFRRSTYFAALPTNLQEAIIEHAHAIDDIVNID